MTLPRHDDQLIQVIALPTQLADEVIHAVDDRHILVHSRVPHILTERLVRLFRLKRDVFLLPPRHADADKFFFLHTLLLHEKGCGLSPHLAFGGVVSAKGRKPYHKRETCHRAKGAMLRFPKPPASHDTLAFLRDHTAAHRGEHGGSAACADSFRRTRCRSAAASARYSWCRVYHSTASRMGRM